MLVDTHCHLDFKAFDVDREMVIARARKAGLSRILVPGVDLASSKAAIRLAELHPEVFAAIGVHPNDSLSWSETTFDELLQLTIHPKVVAIGEIGLDYYREHAPAAWQLEVFQQQLILAAKANLPIILHSRSKTQMEYKATHDILYIINNQQLNMNNGGKEIREKLGVLHSFSGELNLVNKAITMKLMIGISGPVTYPKSEGLRRVIREVPLENILIETDAPFLPPQPVRGKRNEPVNVRLVAEELSKIYGLPLKVIEQITQENAERLFRW